MGSSADDAAPTRAVLFGGAGFIGRHLGQALARRGVEVILADIVRPALPLPEGVRFEACDVRAPIALDAGSVDLVVNLAAVHRTPGHVASDYFDTNVPGAVHISEWCQSNAVPTLVFLSSISVYGPGEDRKTETSLPSPTTPYGRSKLIAENIHREWLSKTAGGTRLIVVRPAAIFGVGERGNFTRLAAALERGRFLYPGRDDVVKSCGYVGDLVEAIFFALDQADNEFTFNFCYPELTTLGDVCRAFTEVAGYAPPRRLSPLLVRPALKAGKVLPVEALERASKLVAATNIHPLELIHRGFDWQTDLVSGFRAWLAESPIHRFE